MSFATTYGIRQLSGTFTAAQQSQRVIQVFPQVEWASFQACVFDPAPTGKVTPILAEFGIFQGAATVITPEPELFVFDNTVDLVLTSRFPCVSARATNTGSFLVRQENPVQSLMPFFVWFWDGAVVGNRAASLNWNVFISKSK